MAINLPAPVAGYFAADKEADATAISHHFTQGAIVRDEGKIYEGREAIRTWKIASSQRYTYSAEPVRIATEAGKTIVTAHLTGDFPGSPLDLRYHFTLVGELIAELEIVA